ncbi:hypothetical protein HN419_01030 [Candidatus Woesearchaeota archaeon]|jgi:DNA polymerase III subunit alpha, Gram-positive type|nr:hypothetical protein [Candidatus Woesearchaeota archaeon]MBT3537419.1 hypothetical protein [Candidatus Woesearchaeota archaeon]MBT4697780.1 hypothetical protein [Candidatus Woesearchaeota archaeon]MBT4717533.1 hypothetical protein [Candidatus Woesearchaeota archaeon]MBT7106271.1 hypothetical protein [Candidatus Woesearchaeota archaeon]
MKEGFVVVDIETTGLSAYMHKITEIGAVKVKDGEVVDRFQSLVNPGVKIPRFITRLTGIDDEMVKDAPKISEVIGSFVDFVGEDVFIAHNATFDFKFLSHNAEVHLGEGLNNSRLCTRKLASRILSELPSKKLSSVCEHYDVENESAHRAMGDVNATLEIFFKMCETLRENEIDNFDKIEKFEGMPCYKARSLLN